MKKLIPTLLFAGALVVTTALHAASFEGKVRMQMSDGPAKSSEVVLIDYLIKEGLFRMEMQPTDKSGKNSGSPISIIMDGKKEEATMLMPSEKMYMVMSTAQKTSPSTATPRGDAPRPAAGKMPNVTFEKTGETETILGYKCEKYLLKEENKTIAMWLTSELGDFAGFGPTATGAMAGMKGGNRAAAQAWAGSLVGKGLFPMRVVGTTPDGKENLRMEVTAIEKKSLPASDFAPPAGWKKFEMPNMGDMMKGMIPGMGR